MEKPLVVRCLKFGSSGRIRKHRSAVENEQLTSGNAQIDAHGSRITDDGLLFVIQSWSRLPETLKTAIQNIVRSI